MGSIIQYIIAGLIGAGAVWYLIYYIRRSSKAAHDCPDCGVSEVHNKRKNVKV